MRRADRIVELADGPTVLDLGVVQHSAENASNDDWLHARLVDAFEDVVGVDYLESEVMKLNRQGYTVIDADVETMDVPVMADTIVIGELIEHLSNPGLMLDRLHGHLKPEGKVILSTPNPWYVAHLRNGLRGRMQINEEHTAWFGPVVLGQLLGRHGFEVSRTEFVGPSHGGLTGAIQRFGPVVFGWPTVLCVATPLTDP